MPRGSYYTLLFDLSFGFKDSFRSEMEISVFSEAIHLAGDSVNHVPSSACPILTSDQVVTRPPLCSTALPALSSSANAPLAAGRELLSWQELVPTSWNHAPCVLPHPPPSFFHLNMDTSSLRSAGVGVLSLFSCKPPQLSSEASHSSPPGYHGG